MHLIITLYCSPKKERRLIHAVNSEMRYPYSSARDGWTRPFMSKAPFGMYDIRCKEEIAPLVLRDIEALFSAKPLWLPFFRPHKQSGILDMKHSARQMTLLNALFYYGRWFVPFVHNVSRAPGLSRFKLIGWHYCFFLGALKDAKTPDGDEIL